MDIAFHRGMRGRRLLRRGGRPDGDDDASDLARIEVPTLDSGVTGGACRPFRFDGADHSPPRVPTASPAALEIVLLPKLAFVLPHRGPMVT